MNTQLIENPCPKCGASIPADAPQGLCPRCVLARAATPTESGRTGGGGWEMPAPEAVALAFPHLEILELLGRGGMGVVYKARQRQLDRFVALKLLPPALGADPAFAERFQREAKFLAKLHHPHIVNVHDFGQAGGFCYLLLEYVDGVNLRQAMQAGRFSPAEALAIVPQICGALQYAHEQGVLHRDIKPENILLDTQGMVKLADFGIAKLLRGPGAGGRPEVTLTQEGTRLGTPHYMAPEQVENPGSVDHRADIYSLGVVFYELLTGELPLGRFAAPSSKADLDARVDAIVLRALAKERELRQQSAGQVGTEVSGLGQPAQLPPLLPPGSHKPAADRPNPWPHRLFWLVMGIIVLPVAAVLAALLAPMLLSHHYPFGAFPASLIPVLAGMGLAIGFILSRPKPGATQPRELWNPWPKRVFWLLVAALTLPVGLAGCLVIPALMVRQRTQPPPMMDIVQPAVVEEVPGTPASLPPNVPKTGPAAPPANTPPADPK